MATKSIGLTGRDFSTMAAWASYVNALTLAAPEIAEVYNDGGPVADTTIVTIGGWTGGSATNTVTLRAAAGHGFKDHATASTNPLRIDSAKGATIQNNIGYASADGAYKTTGAYVTIDGLQISGTGGGGSRGIRGVGANYTIQNCIVQTISTGATVSVVGASSAVSNTAVISKGTSPGFYIESVGTVITGCTVAKIGAAGGYGILVAYGSGAVVKNTVIIGFTNDTGVAGGGTFSASSANNATNKAAFDITNAGGGTPQFSIAAGTDIVNLTSGSEDLRIKAGSTKLIDTGVTSGLAIDIFGTARPQGASYDIGAHEFAAAAAGPVLSAPTATVTGTTTATAGVTTDTAPTTTTLSVQVLPAASAAPTAAAIVAAPTQTLATGAAGARTFSLTGLTSNTAYKAHFAQGGTSNVSSTASFTTNAVAVTLTSSVLKNNTGTVLASAAATAYVSNPTTGALVVKKTGLTTNGSGVASFTDAALVASTSYRVVWQTTGDGAEGLETLTGV